MSKGRQTEKQSQSWLKDKVLFLFQQIGVQNLPKAMRFNLAIGVLLLIPIVLFIAEPVLATLDRMVTSIANVFIAIFSNREYLEARVIEINTNLGWCLIVWVAENILCACIVFFLLSAGKIKE